MRQGIPKPHQIFSGTCKDNGQPILGVGLVRLYHQTGNDSDSMEAAEQALLIEKIRPAIMKLLADALANQAWKRRMPASTDSSLTGRTETPAIDRLFDNPQADNAVMPSASGNLPLLTPLCLFIAELRADDRAKLKWLTQRRISLCQLLS